MPLDRAFGKLEQQDQVSGVERKIFEILVHEHKESAISIEDFLDLYGADIIARDQEYVARVKADIEKRPYTKRAQILEALINEQIELSDWFGPEAQTITPADFDDFRNGVDIAVEFEGEEGFKHLALGVDVTSNTAQLADKLGQVKKRILNGKLTVMKYFKSERSNIRGELGNIPNLVVGASGELIQELSELWLSANNARIRKDNAGLSQESIDSQRRLAREAQKKLAGHRTKVLVLNEMKIQLETFIPFAAKNGQEGAAAKFSQLLEMVNELLTDTEISVDDQIKNQQDQFFLGLAEQLKAFEGIAVPE